MPSRQRPYTPSRQIGNNDPFVTELREFDTRVDAIGSIRSYVQDVLLRGGAPDEAIDAAVLCTSELATNALLHGEGPIGVTLDIGARARIQVHDSNDRPPVRRDASPEDDAGRGLLLVSMFADDWGFDADGAGKTVWFEIDLRSQRSPERQTVDGRRRSTD
jgi:anti-sigma regulatory factor (Ser/Thr protein kinase)